MAMQRTTFPKDLEEGLNAHFGMEVDRYVEEWPRLLDVETSQKAQEEDVLEIGFGGAQTKAEGAVIAEDEGGQSWSKVYVHETIALSFALTEEAIEDNLYQRLGPKYSKAMARAFMHTREVKGAAVINNATSTTGGDGVALSSASHPLYSGGTQSNRLSTYADLAEASLEDLLIMVRRAKDDRSVPQALKPECLVIPPELEYVAIRVCKSPGRPGTADNDINAHRNKGVFGKDPLVMTYLTDTRGWGIKTDCPDGLKHMRRLSLRRGFQEDFKTGNHQYKGRERYSNGYSNWRGYFTGYAT